MDKTVIAFVILLSVLILGIFMMMKPHVFVLKSENEKPVLNQPLQQTVVPRGIIMSASLFIIVGLVGLSILGFKIFKDLHAEPTSES